MLQALLRVLRLSKPELKSKNSKKISLENPTSQVEEEQKNETEDDEIWEYSLMSWLTKDRIVEIMADYPQIVTDQYKNDYYLKSSNTKDGGWLGNKWTGGLIKFMELNYCGFSMRIYLHICLNGQSTRYMDVPKYRNEKIKKTEYGITEDYLRQLIGNFIAQDKALTLKKKVRKMSKDFKK